MKNATPRRSARQIFALLLAVLMLCTLLPVTALADTDTHGDASADSVAQPAESTTPDAEPAPEPEAPVATEEVTGVETPAPAEEPEPDTSAPAQAVPEAPPPEEAEAATASETSRLPMRDFKFILSSKEYPIAREDVGAHDTILTIDGTTTARYDAAGLKNGMNISYYADAVKTTLQPGTTYWSYGGAKSFNMYWWTEGQQYTFIEDPSYPDYHIWQMTFYDYDDYSRYTTLTLRVRKHVMEYEPIYLEHLLVFAETASSSSSLYKEIYKGSFTKSAGQDYFYEYVFAENVALPYSRTIMVFNNFQNRCYINGVEFTADQYANGVDLTRYAFTKSRPYVDITVVPGDFTHSRYVTYMTATWRLSVNGLTLPPAPLGPDASPADKVAADANALTVNNIMANAGAGMLTLPATGVNGSAISWAAQPAGYIDLATGAVSRPPYGQPDVTVTLTATLTHGDATKAVQFSVGIQALGRTDDPNNPGTPGITDPSTPGDPTSPGPEESKATGLTLNMSAKVLKKNKSVTLKATALPAGAATGTITWKSSNTKVATVKGNGKVTARKDGSATITATTENGKKATCKITVSGKAVAVSKVKITKPKSTTLKQKATLTLKAVVSPAGAKNKKVRWSSNKPEVATVSSKGKVKAIAPGKVKITVTTQEGGKKGSVTLTVKAK